MIKLIRFILPELLPLKSRPLVLGEDDANFTFLKYDTSIQNAAENIEILVCSVGENECYDPEYVPITTVSSVTIGSRTADVRVCLTDQLCYRRATIPKS